MPMDFNHFPELRAKLVTVAGQIVRKAAFDIQAEAAATAPGPITGFLKNSIYVVTNDSSSYGAGGGPITKGQVLLAEVEAPASPTEAIIAVGADYGIDLEYGTVKMAPHPYLVPALERVRPSYLTAMSRLEDKLRML